MPFSKDLEKLLLAARSEIKTPVKVSDDAKRELAWRDTPTGHQWCKFPGETPVYEALRDQKLGKALSLAHNLRSSDCSWRP